jgi:hypothetical protein
VFAGKVAWKGTRHAAAGRMRARRGRERDIRWTRWVYLESTAEIFPEIKCRETQKEMPV